MLGETVVNSVDSVWRSSPTTCGQGSCANPLESTLMKKRAAEAHFAQFWCNVSTFRMNICKSVSKQRTLTAFRMNTYEKRGEGGRFPTRNLRRVSRPTFQYPLLVRANDEPAPRVVQVSLSAVTQIALQVHCRTLCRCRDFASHESPITNHFFRADAPKS